MIVETAQCLPLLGVYKIHFQASNDKTDMILKIVHTVLIFMLYWYCYFPRTQDKTCIKMSNKPFLCFNLQKNQFELSVEYGDI